MNANREANGGSALLEIEGLRVVIRQGRRRSPVVDGVDLRLERGEVLGLVGESGCGKTMTALSVLRLVPDPPAQIDAGRILFGGRDLLRLSGARMRRIRGREISMIFQEPMTALNPVHTVGRQVMEVFRVHKGLSRRAARDRTIELFEMVGISAAASRIDAYPHELSGGMRQRVMVAMALVCRPPLIIADEPTTALDVTIQAQVLELLQKLRTDFGTSLLFITHDLGIVAHIADRISIMYAGQIVEEGPVSEIFTAPVHPYTLGLLNSVPRLDEIAEGQRRLRAIGGVAPEPGTMLPGCRFADRCEFVFERCHREMPGLFDYGEGRRTRCFLVEQGATGPLSSPPAAVDVEPQP
jgi:peptide/nickel transport system ATP-binding protein